MILKMLGCITNGCKVDCLLGVWVHMIGTHVYFYAFKAHPVWIILPKMAASLNSKARSFRARLIEWVWGTPYNRPAHPWNGILCISH